MSIMTNNGLLEGQSYGGSTGATGAERAARWQDICVCEAKKFKDYILE